MDDDEEVALEEGMPVSNEEGADLGTLSALLIPEEEGEEGEEAQAEFLVLKAGGVERLVPFEAVLGVGDGKLLLDVPGENVARFPKVRAEVEPTEAEMELAYQVYDEGAQYEADDEEE